MALDPCLQPLAWVAANHALSRVVKRLQGSLPHDLQAYEQLQQKKAEMEQPVRLPLPLPMPTSGKGGPKRPAGAITLRMLVESGILQPGRNVVFVEYKNNLSFGDLTPEGQIAFNGAHALAWGHAAVSQAQAPYLARPVSSADVPVWSQTSSLSPQARSPST